MIRKATQSMIAESLKSFQTFRAQCESKLAGIRPDGAEIIREWLADLESRILAGECRNGHVCTRALARSIVRAIEDFESGRYVGVTTLGGFQCA